MFRIPYFCLTMGHGLKWGQVRDPRLFDLPDLYRTGSLVGATENAELDIARPSKLLGVTSRDWTTPDHIARVDNAAPDQT